eukprot:SM000051S17528  [mRNA]  locus=s51:23171:26056:- [translate_table: standard]
MAAAAAPAGPRCLASRLAGAHRLAPVPPSRKAVCRARPAPCLRRQPPCEALLLAGNGQLPAFGVKLIRQNKEGLDGGASLSGVSSSFRKGAWSLVKLHSAGQSGHSGGAQGLGVRALFTGIVEEMGTVNELVEVDGGWQLTVRASDVLTDVKLGDSIAINGTCLTVTEYDSQQFTVGLSPETLRKTSLSELSPGSNVNLERSLQPNSRMGGHFVQGHVDGTGTISDFREEGDSLWVTVETSPQLLRYIVPKGYVAIDGTSLTVVHVMDEISSFSFMLVAYTQQKIVIPTKEVGAKVNIEVDIVGKYVERMMQGYRYMDTLPVSTSATKVGDWGSLS